MGAFLAIMLGTSAINAYYHSKRHNVIWPVLKIMVPFAVVGAIAVALLMSVAQLQNHLVLVLVSFFYLSLWISFSGCQKIYCLPM